MATVETQGISGSTTATQIAQRENSANHKRLAVRRGYSWLRVLAQVLDAEIGFQCSPFTRGIAEGGEEPGKHHAVR